MSRIAFRVDGGINIGMGHVMRSLVLAKELSKQNEVFFICIKNSNDDYRAGINKIFLNGFTIIEIKDQDIIGQLDGIQRKYKFDCLITDSYMVNSGYFDGAKKIFDVIGYIDDVNICDFNVDFLINQNINANRHKYKFNNIEETKIMLGCKYCMLRDEFRSGNFKKEVKHSIENILITLGGMDEEYNTLKIINELKGLDFKFHIVVGDAFKDDLILRLKEIKEVNRNISIYENANMGQLMKISDLAISASGSTLYELCAMQVPTIGLIIAENQRDICKMMNDRKVIIGVDKPINDAIQDLKRIIIDINKEKYIRVMLKENQSKTINPNGVECVVDVINKVIF